jgi:hypothetical protein
MRKWELADVCDWLQALNMEKYQPAFVAHKLCGSSLVRITGTRPPNCAQPLHTNITAYFLSPPPSSPPTKDDELKALGVEDKAHRKTIRADTKAQKKADRKTGSFLKTGTGKK